jgi:uncharacterized delta-60 repeat protein
MRGAIFSRPFLVLAVLVASLAIAHGQAGGFDPVFAGGSPLNIQVDSFSPLEGQVVLSNGNIVLLTYRSVNGRYVNRLTGITAAGEIDTSFGNNGFVDFAWSDVVSSDRASNIEVQNVLGAERIVVSGGWSQANGRKTPTRLLRIDRFLPNGQSDTAFGTQGRAAFPNAGDGVVDLLIQRDGNILCQGDYGVLVRVRSNGSSIDTSFGSSGVVNTGQRGSRLAIDADDRIYVTGRLGSGKGKGSTIYPSVTRYTPGGIVDATFGSNGNALVPFATASAGDIVIDGSGNIVLGGTDSAGGNQDFAVYRLTSGGALDTTFNGSGRSIFPDFGGRDELQIGLAVQTNGKAVLAGRASYDTALEPNRFAVVRFNADGTIDTDFGVSGAATWSLNQFSSLVNVTARCENEDCTSESLMVSGGATPYIVVAKLNGN